MNLTKPVFHPSVDITFSLVQPFHRILKSIPRNSVLEKCVENNKCADRDFAKCTHFSDCGRIVRIHKHNNYTNRYFRERFSVTGGRFGANNTCILIHCVYIKTNVMREKVIVGVLNKT